MLVYHDKMFSEVVAPIYTPNSRVWEFPLSHILTQFCYLKLYPFFHGKSGISEGG